ncbi:BAG family molecular chaperone regulator 6 [Benincasa hispida]|uniref:BAG family molecular chaperone regulator 6 n=1 Tax=Benincasa hispida TaxID=102211 RepID=UPI0018FFF33C|nr:BAG family molecular chaperone regulator 6 [Benincasa hispida]
MIPIYRYMDSHPFQKSRTPFAYQYPSMETIPSYSMMDPTKSCMPPHDPGHNCWHYGYPMSSYSCCNGGNFFPGCYNFRPSHLPLPPHQRMHCYGGYPPCPEPYYVQYVPSMYYNVEQPRYEFDKNTMRNHHCCGCPNSLCGQNQKDDKCVKIEEEKPDNQRKGSLVPFQLGNSQSPIVWIPPDYMGSEKERELYETGNVKPEKERHGLNLTENLKSVDQAPKSSSGWPLSDLSHLGSLLPDAAGMGAQSVQNKQQDDRKKEFPFPVIWMPAFGREETARKADVHNMDAPARPSDEPSNAGKLVPTNIQKKDDAPSEGPEVVKTVNQINVPEMNMNHKTEDAKKNKERRCIPVEAVKDNEERELLRNNVTGRSSSSSPKKSRLPPVCLRVDPLPKRKNGNSSSRKSTAVKESSQLDSKINNVTGEANGEKIIKTVEVKTHETPDGNQVDKEGVSSTGESLSLPTQPRSQEKFFDKNCEEEEESPSKEDREKDETMSKAYPEKAVDEGLEVSSGDLAQEEGKHGKPNLSDVEAAVVIQSAYRGYEVRKWELLKKMKQLAEVRQKVIEVQNHVKALELAPQDEKERMFVGEMIMRLLLKLDTIQGLHPSIREFRKSLAKELVALQEKLDCMVINKPTEVVPEASIEKPTDHFDVETHDDKKEQQQQKDVVSISDIFPNGVNESNSLMGESHGAQPLGGGDDIAGSEGMNSPTDKELRQTGDGPGELQEIDDRNTTVSEAEQLAKPREHESQNEDPFELSPQNFSNQIDGEEIMPSLMGDKRADEAESGAEMEQNVKVVNDAEKNVAEVLQMDMKEETLDHCQYFSEDGHPAGDSLEVQVLNPNSDDQVEAIAGQTPGALDEITISTPYENGQTGDWSTADTELPEDDNLNNADADKHIEMRREASDAEENVHDLAVDLDSDRTPAEKQGAPDESAVLPGEQSNSTEDLNIQNELVTDKDEQQTADEVEKVLKDVQHQPMPSSELDNQASRACDESAELLEELSESFHDENIQNETVTEKNKMAEGMLQDPCVLDPRQSSKLDNQANELYAPGEATSIEMGEVSLPESPNARRETMDKHDLLSDREMDKRLVDENEKMREMVGKLMEAGKEQIAIISKLSGRVKDLEKRLARKKKQRRGCGMSMSRHPMLNGRIKA